MKSLDADKKASKTSEAAPAAAEVKAEPEKIDFSKVKIEPLFEEAVDFDTFSKSTPGACFGVVGKEFNACDEC